MQRDRDVSEACIADYYFLRRRRCLEGYPDFTISNDASCYIVGAADRSVCTILLLQYTV